MKPLGSLSPGMTNFAIKPARKPMMIVQMMPISYSSETLSRGKLFNRSCDLDVAADSLKLIYVNRRRRSQHLPSYGATRCNKALSESGRLSAIGRELHETLACRCRHNRNGVLPKRRGRAELRGDT